MRYVLPALRITSDVRRQMKNMQQNQSNPVNNAPRPQQRMRKGDYIEFEEVK